MTFIRARIRPPDLGFTQMPSRWLATRCTRAAEIDSQRTLVGRRIAREEMADRPEWMVANSEKGSKALDCDCAALGTSFLVKRLANSAAISPRLVRVVSLVYSQPV